jgi:hypothetical protein
MMLDIDSGTLNIKTTGALQAPDHNPADLHRPRAEKNIVRHKDNIPHFIV